MFKFIHCADLHLDSPLRGLSKKMEGSVDEIRSATRRALEKLVELSIEERIRFVVIAGDVFDGDGQDFKTALFFNECMGKLNKAGIQVFLISGNHDAASNITRSLVDMPNVTRFSVDKPETKLLEEIRVAIHGQGFKTRNVLDNLSLLYPKSLPGYLNIGILHTFVTGQVGHDAYAPCRISDLENKGYDYWALGHIHLRQVLKESPYILYPGNIQGRHIGEAGNKGCTLVTVDNGAITAVEHRDLDVLRWVVCAVDLGGITSNSEYAERIVTAMQPHIENNFGCPLAVRFILTGQTELHGKLMAEPEQYRMELSSALTRLSADQIWIEKIIDNTQSVCTATMEAHHADAAAALKRTSDEAAADQMFLEEFLSNIVRIQNDLRDYVNSPGSTRIDTVEDVKKILNEANDLLAEELSQGGVRP